MEIDKALNIYKGKKVLITGHTGFKGSWLCIWLQKLGANIIGVSLDPKTKNDNYALSNISSLIKDIRLDIRNKESLIKLFKNEQPEIVFHLAAQPLVLESYEFPLETFETNTIGTANILEAIRLTNSVSTSIIITTDKVYENKERLKPYNEEERLGGYDPYSASKGAAEIIISSYRNSFFNSNNYSEHGKSIASVRAGNVIGGGDWSENRIIPDCIKALEKNYVINVRNPIAVRPWQHVLEPLGGYLFLGVQMMENPTRFAEAWNFGPEAENTISVGELVNRLVEAYGSGDWNDSSKPETPHEAQLLALNINKAKLKLGWNPVLDINQTINFTVDWYKRYKKEDVNTLCQEQITNYMKLWKLNCSKNSS